MICYIRGMTQYIVGVTHEIGGGPPYAGV
jgi:hypothetical protein